MAKGAQKDFKIFTISAFSYYQISMDNNVRIIGELSKYFDIVEEEIKRQIKEERRLKRKAKQKEKEEQDKKSEKGKPKEIKKSSENQTEKSQNAGNEEEYVFEAPEL